MRGRVVLFLAVLLLVSTRVEAFIVINEIFADPATGLAGDANADGVRDGNDDEYIELINYGATAVDISSWRLSDAVSMRHTFAANTILDPYAYLVVFGGGSPQLSGVDWLTASTGLLSLNNTTDTITLFDIYNQIIDQVIYGSLANNDQSLVRSPEATGAFALHSLAQGGSFSPGSGNIKPPLSAATVPEPATLVYFLSAAAGYLCRRNLR